MKFIDVVLCAVGLMFCAAVLASPFIIFNVSEHEEIRVVYHGTCFLNGEKIWEGDVLFGNRAAKGYSDVYTTGECFYAPTQERKKVTVKGFL